MRIEILAAQVFMCTTADVVGVVTQIGNTRDLGGERQKLTAAQHGVRLRIGGAKLRQVLEDGLAANVAHLAARMLLVESRESGDQPAAALVRRESIHANVRAGRGRCNLSAER